MGIPRFGINTSLDPAATLISNTHLCPSLRSECEPSFEHWNISLGTIRLGRNKVMWGTQSLQLIGSRSAPLELEAGAYAKIHATPTYFTVGIHPTRSKSPALAEWSKNQ